MSLFESVSGVSYFSMSISYMFSKQAQRENTSQKLQFQKLILASTFPSLHFAYLVLSLNLGP
jgi:hypothetical protein